MLTDQSCSSEEESPPTGNQRRRLIRRKTPDSRPGYPSPEGIMGSWEAFLTDGEKGQQIRRFTQLPAPRQQEIKDKLKAGREWERVNGRLSLARPSRSMFKTFLSWEPTGSDDIDGVNLWAETFNEMRSRHTRARRAQVKELAKENYFPVRSVIYRTWDQPWAGTLPGFPTPPEALNTDDVETDEAETDVE
jgi:hypothetical protein